MTPVGPGQGVKISKPPLIVPVMRAGLGMLNAAMAVLGASEVAFIGISKDGQNSRRECYLSTLADDLGGTAVVVLDPMLATGYTAAFVCEELVRRNSGDILLVTLLAAKDGVEFLRRKDYPGGAFTAAVDAELNDVAFIVPGLGDAGDRQFGRWQTSIPR